MEQYCEHGGLAGAAAAFKLEAVIVCAFYSDFLRETLPHNKILFDRVVVVTAPEDRETQRICEFNQVECIPTDRLRTRWNEFNKGAAINDGLRALDKDAWVVHLDADIWLPPMTRTMLRQAELSTHMLYGVDRFNVPSFAAWRAFVEAPKLQHENRGWLHLDAFPLGTRVTSTDGYVPIGFFQMWQPRASGVYAYVEGHTDAGREDYCFAKKWPRCRRHLLADLVAYHLESETVAMGTNWSGRKTKRFGMDDGGGK